ncbi:alcohol oxidase [Mycena filopes]|nr:alcohol oxidase [Mycena filopes]
MLAPATQVSAKAFHYITSGLTVAARLSEDPAVSVLVLEAGAANLNDHELLTPAAFGTHFGKPQYDWAFETTAQEGCNSRSFPFNRGKGLGGSSAINFFQYHRPAKSDIDAFEELGNAGWNWELLEPYYAKSEHFIQPIERNEAMSYDLSHHGVTGPLAVAYPGMMSNFEVPYQMVMKKLGIPLVKEPTNGTWLTPVTIDPKERVRSYSANKYYQPNAQRKNLTVVVYAHVTRIITKLNPDGHATANEVEFTSGGVLYTVGVSSEVILSAGAIMSPQILELSGIGDKSILDAVGVTSNIDLPGVGKNVQEHMFASVTCELRPEVTSEYFSSDVLSDANEYLRQKELYANSGTGIFATCPTNITFVPLATISAASDTLQKSLTSHIHDGLASEMISPSLNKQYKIQLKHLRDKEPSCEFILSPRAMPGPNPPAPGKQYVTVTAFINHPFSRGTIHIASNDPLVPPKIDPNYFEHNYGWCSLRRQNTIYLLQFVEQIKFCRKILEQEPLKRLLTGTEINPGPDVQTDKEIADFLKMAMSTTWRKSHDSTLHIVFMEPLDTIGSCSMLPLADGGVVDNKLKVYNTTNIRVVDISVIPLHIGAHTQATAYALGELGADIIKGKVLDA